MSIELFEEQLQLYKNGDHSEFRRISLVYSFQDLVNTLEKPEDITADIINSIESLIFLHSIDSNLFREISPDLLEPTIRLQILSAPKFPKALSQLSITLATYSKATDFQKELSMIMKLLSSSETSHPFEKFRESQGLDSKDIFKTVITFYVPIILRMLDDNEIKQGIHKLMDFVEFIRLELHQFHASLGSELMPEIFQVFFERKHVFLQFGCKEVLVFMLELLEIYETIRLFNGNKIELINTISDIFGDFSQILKLFSGFELTLYNPLTVLAGKAIKGNIKYLTLPLVLSGRWRLQNFAPAAALCSYPELRNKILSFCLFYCDTELTIRQFNYCYSNIPSIKLFRTIINNVYEYPGPSINQTKQIIKKLILKITDSDRIKVLEELAGTETSEEKLQFLLEFS